jgi:hypothetical protein
MYESHNIVPLAYVWPLEEVSFQVAKSQQVQGVCWEAAVKSIHHNASHRPMVEVPIVMLTVQTKKKKH